MSRALTRMVATLAAVGMLTLGGQTTILAEGPVEGVAAALLQLEDMPGGLRPLGFEDATYFNIDSPAYEANGGLEKVDQRWDREALSETDKVAAVIDFRMLFPDDVAAQAYLDDAEQVLSEMGTGITLQPDAPSVGDASRLYAGTISGSGLTAEAQNFLFREGPVVAKVYIVGFGTTLDDALPIAQAAADRTAAWLAARPVASPGPSPAPTETAASPAPSMALATTVPSASTGPSFSMAPSGADLRQWATDASASSEYGTDPWSAGQATGVPDVASYTDSPAAWAPAASDGSEEWLELTYAQEVVPAAIGIVETYGNGAVVRVEAFAADHDAWVELWSGDDPSPAEITTFSPPLKPITFATDRLRISFGDIVDGWSEIDAVELVGTVP